MSKKERIIFYFRKVIYYLEQNGLKKTIKKIIKVVKKRVKLRKFWKALLLSEEERKKQEARVFEKQVKFSILVPLYNTPLPFLKEMIDSVLQQTYSDWELCLCDGSDACTAEEIQTYCLQMQKQEKRIRYQKLEKNEGISENTNACIDMATGEYIALFDHDDMLHPSALYEMRVAIEQTNADFLFSDELVFEGTGKAKHIIMIHFKSDYGIDTLRSNNYICHFTVFHKSLLEKTGKFRREYDGSQDHDLFLRLTRVAMHIHHVPKVLYFWRSHMASVASDIGAKPYASIAGRKAVQASIEEAGEKIEEVESMEFCPTIYRTRYEIKEKPCISIIVPCKEYTKEIYTCLERILSVTSYENYEVIVLFYKSEEWDTDKWHIKTWNADKGILNLPMRKTFREGVSVHKEVAKQIPNVHFATEKIRFIELQQPLCYAEAIDYAVQQANGTYYVLLHSDVRIITDKWLEELLMYAQRSDVGVVGAKEYYKNNTVRHAGVLLGKNLSYPHRGALKEDSGYMGRLGYVQNVSAVESSCMMMKKEVYEQMHGMEKEFVHMAAADFCIRLRQAGYWIVFTPFAEVYHFKEKKQKKKEWKQQREQENKIFQKRWKEELEKGDCFWGWNFFVE